MYTEISRKQNFANEKFRPKMCKNIIIIFTFYTVYRLSSK